MGSKYFKLNLECCDDKVSSHPVCDSIKSSYQELLNSLYSVSLDPKSSKKCKCCGYGLVASIALLKDYRSCGDIELFMPVDVPGDQQFQFAPILLRSHVRA